MKTLKNTLAQVLKSTFLLVIVMGMVSFSYAQQTDKVKSLLWKIEGNGLTQPSYLFGTVHMICASNFNMPQKVKTAMDQTAQSYLEINMTAPDFVAQTQKAMLSGKSLAAELSKEDYAFVDSVVRLKLNYNLKHLDKLKAGIITAFIMQKSLPCQVMSFEEEIIKYTKAANKNTGGLSSVEEQYSFVDKILETKDMRSYIERYGDQEMNKINQEIATAYLKEDVKSLDELLEDFSTTNPEGYRLLLPVRNHLWADRMPAIMKDKNTFFGIGSGHLSGKEGVINLLKEKGYKVTPVY